MREVGDEGVARVPFRGFPQPWSRLPSRLRQLDFFAACYAVERTLSSTLLARE
jgi:hypothetical protein